MKVRMQFIDSKGVVLKEDHLTFAETPGTWRMLSTTTGTYINAGYYSHCSSAVRRVPATPRPVTRRSVLLMWLAVVYFQVVDVSVLTWPSSGSRSAVSVAGSLLKSASPEQA